VPGELRHALAATAGADRSTFAAEGNQPARSCSLRTGHGKIRGRARHIADSHAVPSRRSAERHCHRGGYDAAKTDANRFATAHELEGPETIAGAENSKYWRQRWTGKANNVLEFISQDYTSTGVGGILAGHCLPMATDKTFVSCSLPVDYDWGKEVIEFFKAHPMP
jgi:hypothetical protein